jgi:hypothetical protein
LGLYSGVGAVAFIALRVCTSSFCSQELEVVVVLVSLSVVGSLVIVAHR